VAALFTKEKVIERIRFADLDEVKTEIAADALPVYIGDYSFPYFSMALTWYIPSMCSLCASQFI
jgi:hypothetical protein